MISPLFDYQPAGTRLVSDQHRHMDDRLRALPHGRSREITDFLYWVLEDGQDYGAPLYYASLPPPLRERAEAKLTQVGVVH